MNLGTFSGKYQGKLREFEIKLTISWTVAALVDFLCGQMARAYPGGCEGGLAPPSTQTYTGRPKLKL